MDEKVREGVDKLDHLEIEELSENDLDSVAGGLAEDINCNSSWCCSNVSDSPNES